MDRSRPPLYLVDDPQQVFAIRRRMKQRQVETWNRMWVVALVALLGLGLFTSPLFSVRSLRISGAAKVDDAVVRRAARYLIGANFLRARFDRLESALRDLPAVRTVQVARGPVWPFSPRTTLSIRIVERTPLFAVQPDIGALLVDETGRAFLVEPAPLVPVVYLDDAQLKLGGQLTKSQLDPVLMVLRELARAKLPPVAAITITREGFASLALRDGTTVKLGDEEWAHKLRYLPVALNYLRHKSRAAEYIDLTTLRAPVWKPVGAATD